MLATGANDPLLPFVRLPTMFALQRLRSLAAQGRTHAPWHKAVAGHCDGVAHNFPKLEVWWAAVPQWQKPTGYCYD